MTHTLLPLVAGLTLLALGGHYIVKGAINISILLRVSTAVAGLTVVAFGTSLPELAVSLDAASGTGVDIAYANVVGSNIFNIAVILGVVALLKPVDVETGVLRLQYPAMLAVMVAGVVLSNGRLISRGEGIVLTVALFVFLGATILFARRGRAIAIAQQYQHEVEETGVISGPSSRRWTIGSIMIVGGSVALWKGADYTVAGAVTLAETLGVSDRIIGLTVVAMGTSLPELAASIAATRHGDSKIIMGNLLGSNIFNVLAILGITGVVHTVPVTARAMALDNWVQLAFAVVLLPVMAVGRQHVSRGGGILLLTGFLAYFGVLVTAG